MSTGLNIRKDGALDFVSLGALIHRLDPGIIPFRKATECKIHVSGGEFNCRRQPVRLLRPEDRHRHRHGGLPHRRPDRRARPRHGREALLQALRSTTASTAPTWPPSTATGASACARPVVFYNRSNEAAAQLKPGDFDWKAIFAGGVRWFHSGGIFAALSETTAEVIIEGMQAAKAAGAVISFDLNYRAKLWNISGGESRAVAVLDRIVKNVDVLVGNEEDLQKGLGIPGPGCARRASKLDPSAFFGMIDQVTKKHPHVKIVATTLREVHSTNRHSWSAVAWINGKTYQAPTAELDVYDRVGGGDGFAAGFFYGLLTGESPEEAVKLGWAHGALLTTFPGDTTMATLDQVRVVRQRRLRPHPTLMDITAQASKIRLLLMDVDGVLTDGTPLQRSRRPGQHGRDEGLRFPGRNRPAMAQLEGHQDGRHQRPPFPGHRRARPPVQNGLCLPGPHREDPDSRRDPGRCQNRPGRSRLYRRRLHRHRRSCTVSAWPSRPPMRGPK